MMRFIYRFLAFSAALFISLAAFGVGGFPYPVTVVQPDGSSLVISIHGDESFSWKTALDGSIIAQGADGFYYYADYNGGSLNLSTYKVSDGAAPVSTKIIPSVIYEYLLNSSSPRCPARTADCTPATRSQLNYNTIVIPVQFADEKFTTASVRSRVFNLFNQLNYSIDGATGSVRDYFRDNLGSACNLSFDIAEPVTLSKGMAWYGANSSGTTDANIKALVREACLLADAGGVDFSRYDCDSDGMVDNVFIIYAGHNEAEGGGDDTIWPQSWNVDELKLYIDGKKIMNFSCCSEYSGPSGTTFSGIGTICHEYCHYLGLKDMYDVNADTEGTSQALFGTLSVMDMGCYNNSGHTPPFLNIVEREIAGLTTRTYIMNEGRLALPAVQNSSVSYAFRTSYNDEYFLLEYRDGSSWDEYAGGRGLVIYQVDRTDNMAGSMSARMRWKSNTVNCCAAHSCVRTLLSSGEAEGTLADAFFPGVRGVRTVTSRENFAILDWSGRGVGFGISDIRNVPDSIVMDIVTDNGWNLPTVSTYSVQTAQTSARLSWEASNSLEGEWTIVWRQENDVEADTVVTKVLEYDFESLVPGETYLCELFFTYKGIRNKSYNISFKTVERLSSYPLIGGMKNRFLTGEQIKLSILNLVEPYTDVRWYLDDDPLSSDVLSIREPGNYTVRAQISYPDGTVECLERKIIVAGDE